MAQIKRWRNQQCIGFLKEWWGQGEFTHDVTEGEVEMDDGTVCLAWIVTPIARCEIRDGNMMAWPQYGDVTYTKPHIDKAAIPINRKV